MLAIASFATDCDAQLVKRLPMVKGRWDPEASTATTTLGLSGTKRIAASVALPPAPDPLRHKGSPESKPAGAANSETGA